jgi:2-polyprenyl-6-methoxyphenol hydroxylase-like FAD-dependent oxidoreductase
MTLSTVDRYEPDQLGSVGERAVVIGGSIAGLSAARALADGFEEVIVLERDPLPDEPVTRDGAPQTRHPHALLEAGRVTLEDLFPGFSETVLSEGGLLVDTGTETVQYDEGGFLADTEARLPTYCASRALFEHVVRKQVRDRPGVALRGNHQFTGYRTDDDASEVTGVTFRDPEGDETNLATDLVVDATGRTSRTPTWLESHGYEAPPVDEVRIDVTYSTIRIERPATDRRIFLVPPSAPRTRGAAFIPIENGQWEVIVQGVHGDDAPTEPAAFKNFVDSLPVDELGTLLDSQPWVSEGIEHYPYPSSRRHRYEDLDRFPEGLVVTGDAIASFNPIHGQGMSVAALDAVTLQQALADGGLDGIAGRFFDRVAAVVDDVWQMSTGADFDFPQTTGPKPTGTDLFNWYASRLISRAHSDPELSEAFRRVMRLEQAPTTLFRPRIVWRVLRPSFSRPRMPLGQGEPDV